ncbi:hypothetical protein K469DRAFT_755879 [Zopfia rhizophila CBS 207.26]|uniref:Uncharacterized protein n=1 Tax=Zopfia rhizophila CBS 207.26 TaxID=1314779 RepID=A0A6A6DAL4_9PEZI|nr:hypothetical protein K469DRAFT_755879 [Zopfia rhizophila CBS 207.26]
MYPKTMASITEKVVRTEGLNFWDRFLRRFKPAPKREGPEYSSLVDDDEEASISSQPDTPPAEAKPNGRWGWLKAIAMLRYPLYISIIIHTLILFDLIWAHWVGRINYGQYGKGFHTDFGMISKSTLIPNLPKGVLQLEKVRFTHSLRAHENGTIYGNIDTNQPQYVGTPSPEIDANWEALVGGRYIKLHLNEVEKLNKADDHVADLTSLEASSGVVDTPQFDPDYYEQHLQSAMKHAHRMKMRMHVDHCIDQLRQAILCHGDLTPVTLRPVLMNDPSADLVGETERVHTCRNWKAIREWLTERGQNDGFLPPKHSDSGDYGHSHID